jgi:hypothetical protein
MLFSLVEEIQVIIFLHLEQTYGAASTWGAQAP